MHFANGLHGIHQMRMVLQKFSKDEHGMQISDIEHEAVMQITNNSVLTLLQKISDAKGTCQYLIVLRCVVDS